MEQVLGTTQGLANSALLYFRFRVRLVEWMKSDEMGSSYFL
jgi:hypothetical protein